MKETKHLANLKKLRLERSLSQQKLADNFGITQQAIFNYENGISEPDLYTLKQFADFFHTSIDYLVGYTEQPVRAENPIPAEYFQNCAKELHHLALYQKLPAHVQDHLDAILDTFLS